MGVAVPLKTLSFLSGLDDPEEFKVEVNRMIGNAMPEVLLNRVLCAVYIASEKMSDVVGPQGQRLVRTLDAVKEDIWQGKPCLVLKVGPAAFVDDAAMSFYGQKVKPGDWVTFKMVHATQQEINRMPCRIIEDRFIEAIFHDPRHVTS